MFSVDTHQFFVEKGDRTSSWRQFVLHFWLQRWFLLCRLFDRIKKARKSNLCHSNRRFVCQIGGQTWDNIVLLLLLLIAVFSFSICFLYAKRFNFTLRSCNIVLVRNKDTHTHTHTHTHTYSLHDFKWIGEIECGLENQKLLLFKFHYMYRKSMNSDFVNKSARKESLKSKHWRIFNVLSFKLTN